MMQYEYVRGDIMVGRHVVPLLVIATLVVSGVGAGFLAYYIWNSAITLRTSFGDEQDYSLSGEITTIEYRIIGIRASCPVAGIAESISVLLSLDRGNATPSEPFTVKCALYVENANSIVKYAETETLELSEDTKQTLQWYTFNFTDPKPLLENRTYWIVALAQVVPGFPYMYAGGFMELILQSVDHFEFPQTLSDPRHFNKSASIYCTYRVTWFFMAPFIILFIIACDSSIILVISCKWRRNTPVRDS
jgi:hypothetical protein